MARLLPGHAFHLPFGAAAAGQTAAHGKPALRLARSVKSARSFRRLNYNLLIVHLVIGVLIQPLAAYYTAASLAETAATVIVSTLFVTVVCFAKLLRLHRLRWVLFSCAFASMSGGVYALNGGLFGTSIDPLLFTCGTASFMAVDGTMVSLLAALIGGALFTVFGSLISPKYYFGVGAPLDVVRIASHIVWWSVLVLSGYMLGRGVHRIIDDLEGSRIALESAQASEGLLRQKTESDRAATEAERKETFERLGETFDAWMQTAVNDVVSTTMTVSQEAASTQEMATATEQISGLVVDVANESYMSMQVVATATGELSTNIEHSREHVASAAAAMSSAEDRVRESGHALKTLVSTGRQIDQMVSLISKIADQTRLLALNASVEAARAGKAGDGFAGVSIDLKRLASLTSQATAEVGILIANVQAALAGMVHANAEIERSVVQANGYTRSVAAIMHQQNQATAKIAETVNSIALGTRDASAQMASAAAHAERTARTAEAMHDCVATVDQDVTVLRREAIRFVTELREV